MRATAKIKLFSIVPLFCTEARFTIIRTISLANVAFRHYKLKKHVWYSIPFLSFPPQESEWTYGLTYVLNAPLLNSWVELKYLSMVAALEL